MTRSKLCRILGGFLFVLLPTAVTIANCVKTHTSATLITARPNGTCDNTCHSDGYINGSCGPDVAEGETGEECSLLGTTMLFHYYSPITTYDSFGNPISCSCQNTGWYLATVYAPDIGFLCHR